MEERQDFCSQQYRRQMLRLTLAVILVVGLTAASVPCVQNKASTIANASSCSMSKPNATTLAWGAQINFKSAFTWTEKSWSNALGDPKSPRLPYRPLSSSCNSHPGSYTAGQSAVINCTQTFDAIPSGYANLISAFEDTNQQLDFSFLIVGSENLLIEQ